MPEKFLFLFSLRCGGIFLGCFNCVASLFLMYYYGTVFIDLVDLKSKCKSFKSSCSPESVLPQLAGFTFSGAMRVVFFTWFLLIVNIIFSVMLITGIRQVRSANKSFKFRNFIFVSTFQKRSILLQPYLILGAIQISMESFLLIYDVVTGDLSVSSLINIFVLIFGTYIFLCLLSLYKKIKEGIN